METLTSVFLIFFQYLIVGFINGKILKFSVFKVYYGYLVVMISVCCIIYYYFGAISSVIYGVLLMLLSLISEKNHFVAIISSSISLNMYIILNYVVDFFLAKLGIYNYLSVLQIVFFVAIIYLSSGLALSAKFKKVLINLTSQKEVGLALSIMLLLTLASYYDLILEETYFNLHSYLGISNLFFILIYAGALIITAFFAVVSIKIYVQDQIIRRDFEHLTEYMRVLEATNSDIRKFHHDYRNILLTIESFLDDKSFFELDEYFRENILPTISELDNSCFKMSKIKNLEIREIKSIVANKALVAQQKGIDTIVEVPYPIKVVSKKNTMVLVRSLGIILDNAIEAAIETNHPKLKIGLLESEEALTIIIENTCLPNVPPINKLKEDGFSTKGDKRGQGLFILNDLVSKSKSLFLDTRVENESFIQRLIIEKERV